MTRREWKIRATARLAGTEAPAVVAAVVGSQLRKSKAAAGALADYQYVRTTTLKTTSLNDSVTVNGTVKSGDEASVTVADSAKTYKVATVNVEVGDKAM
jgi:multidrug efflux pump subunit AcrA (membrane-fusion protein)